MVSNHSKKPPRFFRIISSSSEIGNNNNSNNNNNSSNKKRKRKRKKEEEEKRTLKNHEILNQRHFFQSCHYRPLCALFSSQESSWNPRGILKESPRISNTGQQLQTLDANGYKSEEKKSLFLRPPLRQIKRRRRRRKGERITKNSRTTSICGIISPISSIFWRDKIIKMCLRKPRLKGAKEEEHKKE